MRKERNKLYLCIAGVLLLLLLIAGCNLGGGGGGDGDSTDGNGDTGDGEETEQAASPTFDPPAGTYEEVVTVTIASTTPGSVITCTTDGSDPFTSGTAVQTDSVTVESSLTIKAFARADGYEDSGLAEAEYVIEIPEPVFYVAGYYIPETDSFPCYWKDGERTDLEGADDAGANAVFVDGEDVYIGGNGIIEEEPAGEGGVILLGEPEPLPTACVWKNGSITALPHENEGYVQDIIVMDGSIYAVGSWGYWSYMELNACYWKISSPAEKFDLPVPPGTMDSEANAIFNEGSTVYAAGYYYDSDANHNVPCYWSWESPGTPGPDNLFPLPVPADCCGIARDIVVMNGTPYICGNTTNGEGANTAVYWNAETLHELDDADNSKALAIFRTEEGDLYIAGSTGTFSWEPHACYWRNEERTDVASDLVSEANGIQVLGTDIDPYISGWFSDEDGASGFLWFNGNFMNTFQVDGADTYATDLFITQ